MTNFFNFDPRFEDQPQSATPHRPTTSATPCRREPSGYPAPSDELTSSCSGKLK